MLHHYKTFVNVSFVFSFVSVVLEKMSLDTSNRFKELLQINLAERGIMEVTSANGARPSPAGQNSNPEQSKAKLCVGG